MQVRLHINPTKIASYTYIPNFSSLGDIKNYELWQNYTFKLHKKQPLV